MKKTLTAGGSYFLRSVVFSHGWSDLPPFRVADTEGTVKVGLHTVQGPRSYVVRHAPAGLHIEGDRIDAEVENSIRWMFRLDDDLEDFYGLMKKNGRPWAHKLGMGRLVRSQTVFEDLVKLVLTTNCSWSFTRLMSDRLTAALGEETPDGTKLFPTAQALAGRTEKFYRDKIRSGYRSPHLRTIGKLVISGAVQPDRWKDPSLSTEEVRKEILQVPGAGPYVADNLLRYLGRSDRLGLDSWARGKLKKVWKMKKAPTDKAIERRYKPFGAQRGLVLWCDLTRDWLEDT